MCRQPSARINLSSPAGDQMFEEIRALRRSVLEKWQERAVTLSEDEREELIIEMREMSQLFSDLAGPA